MAYTRIYDDRRVGNDGKELLIYCTALPYPVRIAQTATFFCRKPGQFIPEKGSGLFLKKTAEP